MIPTIKIVDLNIKWFHMMRRVQIRCFFFILKMLKNISEFEKIFGFELFLGFKVVFLCVFLEVISWFNKVSKVFWVKIDFFLKKLVFYFSGQHSG
jgi:hypothetical protein